MGIYVYTVRATRKPINIKGQIKTAHLLSFAHKESNAWSDDSKLRDRQLSIAERTVEKYNPQYVVIGDKFEVGNVVYEWPKGLSSCLDTPDYKGKFIGYLNKIGCKWVVVEKDPTRR